MGNARGGIVAEAKRKSSKSIGHVQNEYFVLSRCRPIGYRLAMDEPTRDHGPQPLDRWLNQWQMSNHDLVTASGEQLSHKQVQKARSGRHLTLHLMQKVMRAFNAAIRASLDEQALARFVEYPHRQLFNYAKNHDPAWKDPNEELLPPATAP